MNQIITPSITRATPPRDPSRDLKDLTAKFDVRIVREAGIYSISDRNLPSTMERGALEARQRELSGSMSETPKVEIAQRVARLFLRFPSAAKTDAEATTTAYATDLCKYPLWAIDLGIIHAIEHWKSAFAPSSPELQEIVAKKYRPYSDELRTLRKILNAQVFHEPDDDEKARVRAGFLSLARRTGMMDPYGKRKELLPPHESPAAVQARLLAEASQPIAPLSADTLIRMGVAPAQANRQMSPGISPERGRQIINGE